MKHAVLLLTLSIFISVDLFSQRGFHIGAYGTFNTSWILSQNNFETLFDCPDPLIQKSEMAYDLTFGYNAGAAIGYNFTDNHGIQIDLSYSHSGQNYEDGYTSTFCPEYESVRREVDLIYFQFPIQYRYSKGAPRSKLRWFITAGPQMNFGIRASESVYISGIEKMNFQVEENQKFNKFDFGLALAGGINYFLSQEIFVSAALSSYMGITDINGQNVQDFISLNDIKYRQSRNARGGIQIGIHYFLANHYHRPSW